MVSSRWSGVCGLFGWGLRTSYLEFGGITTEDTEEAQTCLRQTGTMEGFLLFIVYWDFLLGFRMDACCGLGVEGFSQGARRG